MCQGFDKLTRFHLAASDMRIVHGAALALIDARERDGPARLYERVIETGMVVTYVRPFLESNEAGIGKKWWPQDAEDRSLHDELVELRHEYHAHAAHTPRRRLENISELMDIGRPTFTESWTSLDPDRLRALADLSQHLASTFHAEAEALDQEVFGPR
jgi:hypothetical protein